MIFAPLSVDGAFLISAEPSADARGSFARVWCAREFAARGLDASLVQSSVSTNTRRGTLRGMHYSLASHGEAKLVRCIRGAIYDVLLDLRTGSPTHLKWCAETLSAENLHAVYIPPGVAHGFQTLEDGSDVLYGMSAYYDPQVGRGVRWDDPAFGITWPTADRIMSDRDRNYADYLAEGATRSATGTIGALKHDER